MMLEQWMNDWMLGRFARQWWLRYLAAGAMTVASILVVAILWRGVGAIGDPSLILLFTVAVSTYLAGGMAGMLSAAIVLFCSFVLFSHPLHPFRYSEMDWRQMMVVAIACPLIALMVGSLKEQVDRLKIATKEVQALRDEVGRLEVVKELQFLCEQRFRRAAECILDYAICMVDASGTVRNWNASAERVLGYSDPEIVGQSYSRFFVREDLLARLPERLLEQAHFSGRAEEEGWRLRKGGGRFLAKTILVQLRNSSGVPAGCLMVIHDLTAFQPSTSVEAISAPGTGPRSTT
jgi:PAS domain S-box-containing protein